MEIWWYLRENSVITQAILSEVECENPDNVLLSAMYMLCFCKLKDNPKLYIYWLSFT